MNSDIERIETETTEWADGTTSGERKVIFYSGLDLHVNDPHDGLCRVTSIVHQYGEDCSDSFLVRGRLLTKDGKKDRRTWSHTCGFLALDFFGRELP